MPPRPDVPYSGIPSVVPSTQQPDNTFRVQAGPAAFGGQSAAAMERGGAQIQQLGNDQTQLAIQQQGMINETLATNAESDYLTKAGTMAGQFRSLNGLAAAQALPKFQNDLDTLRTSLRANLPAGAARAFDTLTMRHQGYYIGDANAYAAQQIKVADTQSAHASMQLATSRGGDAMVASNDARFGSVLQDVNFQAARILVNQGYGPEAGTGMSQDPKTGEVTFNDTPAGQQAKAAYDNMVQTAAGIAWQNRLHTLADQNVDQAYALYQTHRGDIPGDAQVKLDAFFQPRIRASQAQGLAEGIMGDVSASYHAGAAQAASNPNNMGNVKAPGGGFATPATPVDGVVLAANTLRRGYQGLTLQQIGQKWEGTSQQNINNWVNNVSEATGILPGTVPNLNDPIVLQNLLGGIATAEKSKGDRAQFTDGVIAQGVDAALGGKTANMAPNAAAASPYRSEADYYRANYDQIITTARDRAQALHPDDPVFVQQATARVEQRVNDVIRQQELSYKQDGDMVYQAVTGAMSNGQRPTSVAMLMAISPDVKAAWGRLQTENPLVAANIENRLLIANGRGDAHDLMTYGPQFYTLFNQVHETPGSAGRMTDPNQLYQYLGNGLTMAGLETLRGEMAAKATPESAADSAMVKSALAYAKHQLSFEADYGSFKIPDPQGEDAFNIHFLPAFFKAYDAGVAAGKTPYQLLSKDSPDFIVDKLVTPWKRSQAQWMQDRLGAGVVPNGSSGAGSNAPDLSTPQGLIAAVQSGQVSRDEGEALALKRGWIRAAAPAGAPGATDNVSVPISK